MQDQKESQKKHQDQTDQSDKNLPPNCTCIGNPYAELPAELRPRPKKTMGGLRKATCPNCGLNYWTNRQNDLCIDCEKKGVRHSETKRSTGP